VIEAGADNPGEVTDGVAPASRMAVATLALIGLLIATYTLAYKLGLIGTIVCGTGGCETVQNSPWAVQLGVPVPVLGVAGYGAMLVLALLGLQPSLVRARPVSVLLLVGGIIAFVFTAYLTYLEAYVIHAWCRWCLASAAVSVAMLLAVLPEAARLRRQ
jgi:uncharacterized membrane protein